VTSREDDGGCVTESEQAFCSDFSTLSEERSVGRFFEALKAGARAFKEGTEPTGYSVGGRPVRCPHCGQTKFAPGDALLNTRGATLFNLDWANPLASILICAECGRIEWFANPPDEIRS
jgi:hypothetical protein